MAPAFFDIFCNMTILFTPHEVFLRRKIIPTDQHELFLAYFALPTCLLRQFQEVAKHNIIRN